MYGALIWNGSAYKGQGEQLRDWLIEGAEMLVSSTGAGTGTGSGTNYRPSKPTGGGSSTPITGNTGTVSGNSEANNSGDSSTGNNTGGNDSNSSGSGSSGQLPTNTYTISSNI